MAHLCASAALPTLDLATDRRQNCASSTSGRKAFVTQHTASFALGVRTDSHGQSLVEAKKRSTEYGPS